MSDIPNELKYANSHEWVRVNEDSTVTIGISDHAQSALGDVVYVELPEVDQEAVAGSEIALVESVKAASDIYSPISGTVLTINDSLVNTPENLNESCYDTAWLFTLQPSDLGELDALLSAEQYKNTIESGE